MERRIAHAVIHPVRLDALSILFEQVASPKEIHRMLGVPLATVSFHVAELAADEVVELVKTEPRRGAIEHYYRARLRPEISTDDWRELPTSSRRKIAALSLQAIVAEGLSSLRHEKMETDDDLNLIWIPMRLGSKGHEEVSALQAETLERYEAIKARDEARSPEEGEIGPTRIATMMWFERGGPGCRPGNALDLSEIE